MKRQMISVILILCIIMLSAFSCVTASGYSAGDGEVFRSESGLYLFSLSGCDLHMERVVPAPFSQTVTLPYSNASVQVIGDRVVALCDDAQNDQTIFCVYEIGTGVMESIVLSSGLEGYHRGFYLDHSGILIQSDDRPSVITRYSLGGSVIDRYDFRGSAVQLLIGYDARLYVLCDGMLYRYADGGYQPIGGASLTAPASFIAPDRIADSRGGLYQVSSSGVSRILQAESGFVEAVSNGYAYIVDGRTVCRCRLSDGVKTDYYAAGAPISALYAASGELYLLSDYGSASLERVSQSAFVPYPTEPPPTAAITSDLYRVDSDSFQITRIPSPTTFAQLKSHLRYGSFSATLLRGEKNVKSGRVGTAMTLIFSGDEDYAYELSVVGDLTGEGNVNSRDLWDLMGYFLHINHYEGVYIKAADINDDGVVNVVDLALLARAADSSKP